MSITGQCRCGACRYEIAIDELPAVYACHCHVCQRVSGSAFSVQALVAEDKLTVTGPIVVREIVTEDRTSIQRFCGECLARVYNTNTRRPGIGWSGRGRSTGRRSWCARRTSIRPTNRRGWSCPTGFHNGLRWRRPPTSSPR